ncbi:hypothetical protein OYC64_020022 [Pagothenia borchgrevinki]|uniref:Uncharacterized protein n=1 Tax=Pagothenia borchgrevinki TaxID=8213 RepID=A0ABD2FJR9_PAGBO
MPSCIQTEADGEENTAGRWEDMMHTESLLQHRTADNLCRNMLHPI